MWEFSGKKSNMDFIMSGPRLQVSTVDGYENIGGFLRSNSFNKGTYHWTTLADIDHTNIQYNDIVLADTYTGRQRVYPIYWPTGATTKGNYMVREKMAFKTNVQDIYVIVTVCGSNHVYFHYTHVGTFPIYTAQSAIPARALTFELPRDKWYYYSSSTGTPGSISRTNSYVYYAYNSFVTSDYGATGNDSSAASQDGFGYSANGYITKTVDSTKITYTIEFPAQYNAIRYVDATDSAWDIIPLITDGRILGNTADRVNCALTGTWGGSVAKVYSPIKGCLCLKSFMNGEIPIMNE